MNWLVSSNSPAPPIIAQGNGPEASIALAIAPRLGGLEKYEGNPLPERCRKDRKHNGYEQHNGQEQG
jgi:hypothetical protein